MPVPDSESVFIIPGSVLLWRIAPRPPNSAQVSPGPLHPAWCPFSVSRALVLLICRLSPPICLRHIPSCQAGRCAGWHFTEGLSNREEVRQTDATSGDPPASAGQDFIDGSRRDVCIYPVRSAGS